MTTYSFIVPAYNEEQLLPATLRALHQEMQRMEATGEVIVVDNNSTDRTSAIAAESGARVVLVKARELLRGHPGRTHGQLEIDLAPTRLLRHAV